MSKGRSNPLLLISLPNMCPNDGSIENTKVAKCYKVFFQENNKLYYVNCKISLKIYFLASRKVKIQDFLSMPTLVAPIEHTHHSVHSIPPFLLGVGGVEPLTKFSKMGGLKGSQL